MQALQNTESGSFSVPQLAHLITASVPNLDSAQRYAGELEVRAGYRVARADDVIALREPVAAVRVGVA